MWWLRSPNALRPPASRSWWSRPGTSRLMTASSSLVTWRPSWRRPASTPTSSRPKSAARCPVADWSPEMATILVIEDNPANMALATFLLQSVGHTVLSTTDAEAGLTLAREQQPHLILMDIQLPGMDGLKATALLKGDEATRAIPVIALTALAMAGDEERIRGAGFDGYIAKPSAYRELLATISAQLVPKPELARS